MSKLVSAFSKTFLVITFVKLFDVVRNLIVASLMGVSDKADVFSAVVSIPEGIIVLVGIDSLRGVINSEYSTLNAGSDRAKIIDSFGNLFQLIILAGLFLTTISIIFRKEIIDLLLPGFAGEKKLEAYSIAAIIFPLIFLKVLMAFLQSVYNSFKNFVFPLIIQIVINVAMIASIIVPFYQGSIIYNLAFGLAAGNVLVAILLIVNIRSLKLNWQFPGFRLSPDDVTKKIIRSSGSVFLVVFINQIYFYSRNVFASEYGEGAISSIAYASTFTGVLMMVVFNSVFNVLLSDIAEGYSYKKKIVTKEVYLNTLLSLLVIACPAVIFMLISGREILTLFYQRGAIDSAGIDKILQPYYWEVLSFFSWILFTIPTSLYLAVKKYKWLSLLSSVAYLTGIFLNFMFTEIFGYYGISVATFVTLGLNGVLLNCYARRFLGRFHSFWKNVSKVGLSFVLTLSLCYLAKSQILPFAEGAEDWRLLVAIGFSAVMTAGIFLIITFIFKLDFLRKIYNKLRK